MSKVWFITGSSRGLGRALTEVVLESGYLVVATARKPEQLADLNKIYGDRVRTVKLDVTISPGDADPMDQFQEPGVRHVKRSHTRALQYYCHYPCS